MLEFSKIAIGKKFVIPGAAALGTGMALYLSSPERRRKLKDTYNYTSYLARHKYNIIGPGRQIGAPLSTLLKHDLSKLKSNQFGPYRDWFEGPTGIKGTREPKTFYKWRKAVKKHFKEPSNVHHWRRLGKEAKDVPLKHRLESVADWYSVGKTKAQRRGRDFPKFKEWYEMRMHIEKQLSKSAYVLEKLAAGPLAKNLLLR